MQKIQILSSDIVDGANFALLNNAKVSVLVGKFNVNILYTHNKRQILGIVHYLYFLCTNSGTNKK